MKVLLTYKNYALKPKVDAFKKGERAFTTQELSDIKLYLLIYKDTLANTTFFTGSVKEQKVISCLAEDFYDDLFDHMLRKLAAAIAIIVIPSQKRIILKRNEKICNLNLCNLAKIICGGECDDLSDNIAEGVITKTFLNFTKTLSPC